MSNALAAKKTNPPQVCVEIKPFLAALKAVREFVSTDPTRFNLTNVHAEVNSSQLRLTATDGHTLCSVELPCSGIQAGSANLSDAVVEGIIAIAKGEKTLAEVTVTLEDMKGSDFPHYEAVIPAKEDDGQTNRVQGFNAIYLARCATVQKTLKAPSMRLQFGPTNQDALRADIKGEFCTAVVVVMPVRV